MSQLLGNAGPRITNAMGNMVGGVNLGRNISSGGLSIPVLSSRLNLAANSGSGLNVQGQNRMLGGGLPQGIYDLSSSFHFCLCFFLFILCLCYWYETKYKFCSMEIWRTRLYFYGYVSLV